MIQLTRKKEVEYTVWEAIDGTQFDSLEECEKYEKSALGVLKGKFQELVVDRQNAWDLINGNDDNDVLVVRIRTQEDADAVLQLYYLEHPYMLKADYDDYRANLISMVTKALQDQDYLLLGENCDGELYTIDTRNNMIERLNNLGKNENKSN